jgi:hypothetical protein
MRVFISFSVLVSFIILAIASEEHPTYRPDCDDDDQVFDSEPKPEESHTISITYNIVNRETGEKLPNMFIPYAAYRKFCAVMPEADCPNQTSERCFIASEDLQDRELQTDANGQATLTINWVSNDKKDRVLLISRPADVTGNFAPTRRSYLFSPEVTQHSFTIGLLERQGL